MTILKKYMLLFAVAAVILSGCGAADAPEDTAAVTETALVFSGFGFDLSQADRISLVQEREQQSVWETTDEEDIAEIISLWEQMEFGAPESGGYAGEFMCIKFYREDTKLGEIHLATLDEIMFFPEGASHGCLVPIVSGGWSEGQWNTFLRRCERIS